jgi:tripartite-type tricarboxylate transporter receptor subunit TctC
MTFDSGHDHDREQQRRFEQELQAITDRAYRTARDLFSTFARSASAMTCAMIQLSHTLGCIAAIAVVAVTPAPCSADSQEIAAYPTKSIRFVNSGVAGSIPDSIARPLAERLALQFQQPVVVDNRPGAGGMLAMEIVARAKPDGYTIGVATMSQIVFNPYLFDKLTYDPVHDIIPVIKLVSGKVVIVAHPSFPANTISELIAYAKSNPGKIDYAVPQFATPPHIFALMFTREAQIEMVAVPFRGNADALSQLLAGQVPVGFDAPAVLAPHIKAGKLKALAVIGRERSPMLPGVPTLAESGFPELTHEAFFGIVVPAGVAPGIVGKLNHAIAQELHSTDLRERFQEMGWDVAGGSSQQFAGELRQERTRWQRVIRAAGLKVN